MKKRMKLFSDLYIEHSKTQVVRKRAERAPLGSHFSAQYRPLLKREGRIERLLQKLAVRNR